MEIEPDPDNPRDYESRLSISLVFKQSIVSDIIFSVVSLLENILIILFSIWKRNKYVITSHIPRQCMLPFISNSRVHIFPLNTIILSLLHYKLKIPRTLVIIIVSSIYSFLTMYLFRNMLFTLRLKKYINALSMLLLVYPLEHIIQQSLASRDSLLLIFFFAAVIAYQLDKPILLNILLILASITGPQGSVLFIGFIIGYLINKKQIRSLTTVCAFSFSVFLGNVIGFYHLNGGLLNQLKEYAPSIVTHRQTEAIIQFIIVTLFAAFVAFVVSRPIAINSLLLIILSVYGPTSNGMRTIALAQIISFVGLSYAMTPRIKNGVFFASAFFIIPIIYIVVNRLILIPEQTEFVE